MAMKTTTISQSNCVFLSFLVILILTVSGEDIVPTEHEACQFWQNVAHQMSAQTRSQMHCTSNGTSSADVCTKLDCTGTYKYQTFIPSSSDVEVDYCFGIVLNHCVEPITLDIYLQMPHQSVSFQQRVQHDEMMKIPGGSFKESPLGTADVFLNFHMVKISPHHVEFGMSVKVRISTTVGLEFWPRDLQRTLVPKENIPVPPCESKVLATAPSITLGTCQPPHWRQPSSSEAPPTHSKPTEKSATLNKTCSDMIICSNGEGCNIETKLCQCTPDFLYDAKIGACVSLNQLGEKCDIDMMNECGPNEMCDKNGVCDCIDGHSYNTIRQICVHQDIDIVTTITTMISPITTPITHAPLANTAQSSTNSTAIIAGCVSAVVVLVIIGVVIYLAIRRKQSQYYDRHALISDDDDPLVI
ncbi:hypothetical protein LOTGIDRAFT_232122 [Lottia gigantea]|uniref:EGF-like domain-containing protein n=1 Tax=Lottia gigantea TaxID=225164 RepID=V4AMY6_LOTGI|nr:hypothetical protein LOTGIDRAFT_232122 [Lottia gigantea]ESO94971.1 hypothetical protein LOTGIDRAFT_232122 [Lottia gigantea]